MPAAPQNRLRARPTQPAAFRNPFGLWSSSRCGWLHSKSGHTGDDPVILRERPTNDDSACGNLIAAELVAVIAAAHFDHSHDAAQLSLDLDIALDDDFVGNERNLLRRESNVGEPFHDLGATTVNVSNTGGTDHQAFDAVGLPGFQFIQDEIEYSTRTHHTNMDSYDHLREDDLKQIATIVAAFVYNTAQRDEKLPRKALPQPRGAGRL